MMERNQTSETCQIQLKNKKQNNNNIKQNLVLW